MSEKDLLADRFEANRPQLRAVAYRMLGSSAEADDAVQEAWLRLSRTDTSEVDNLGAWLTTVVGRICLDMLRSRGSRREDSLEARTVEPVAALEQDDPEREAMLADSVGLALLVVLETLTPAERLAFVLHDLFAVPYEEIAPIVGRSPAASRQLASRARRRVQADATTPEADLPRQREIVDAFLTAARGGEVTTLLTLLDPDVVVRADSAATRLGGTAAEIRGAERVAGFFAGRARGARTAVVDGVPGAVVVVQGRIRIAISFIVGNGRIIGIDAVADLEQLRELDITMVSD
ncbi:sigma-70 family RNA polymerase sigma factor [Plantactinospora mayteni]|uniref:RNA polymerase sigma factor n=1 Tax=Plantactinospora mayteni TaxID=566021 RepID=A0ABQ4EJ64_9ACTN|nr:sigma-70 family RNA polymerase sigma factor [Plantactinospora mayteni]GIG94779.1 RNA polymerase sigma factor [Plantactinospora mayteni]